MNPGELRASSYHLAAEEQVDGKPGIKGALAFNNKGLNINGGIYIANTQVTSGSFVVDADTGSVSWKNNVNIGFSGFNSTLWLQMKNPYGAGYKGRAYVDLDIPIYVWGPIELVRGLPRTCAKCCFFMI